MQNLDTMSFIIKENMSLEQLLLALEKIYSRDLLQLDTEKKETLTQVSGDTDLPSNSVRVKLSKA